MNRIISISLIVVLVSTYILKLGILGHFLYNQSYYSTVLCDNKDKPKMQCNGKCHLSKELQSTEQEPDKNHNAPQLLKYEVSLFTIHHTTAFKPEFLWSENAPVSHYQSSVANGFLPDIFHPPAV